MNKKEGKSNKKTFVFITCTLLTVLAVIFLFSLFRPVSPLGTYIGVWITCDQTQEPIVGLPVTVTYPDGTPVGTLPTDEFGFAGWFGSGIPDGDYIIEYFWCEPVTHTVTINCTKMHWEFFYTVDNPQIIKHFYYDIYDGKQTPPVVGMNVSLYKDGILIDSQLTDATGTVSWYVDICHEYNMSYIYGGITYYVPADGSTIHFDCPTCPEDLIWEAWNPLEPKSVETMSENSLWLIQLGLSC